MRFGIAPKITLLFVLLVIILGVSLGYYFLRYQKETLLSEFDEKAKILLDSLAVNSEYPVLIGDDEALGKIAQGVLAQKDVVFCGIRNLKGDILFQGGIKKEKQVLNYSSPILTEKISESAGEELVLGSGKKEYEEIGQVLLSVSLENLMYKMAQVRRAIGLLVIVGIIVAFLFISLLTRFILGGPIHGLIEGIQKISAGDLDYQVPVKTKDEIGMLADSFNKMTKDLQSTTTSVENLNKEVIERKKAEETLRKTEKKYRMQFEGALDAIFVADPETGIVIDCNPAATTLIGWEKSELIGKHQAILHPREEKNGEFSKTFQEHIKNKAGQMLETKVITKDGKVKDVAIVANLIDIGGKRVLQGIFRDITQSKRAQEEREKLIKELEQSKQVLEESRRAIKNVAKDLEKSRESVEDRKRDLEKINKELDDFTYVVSHDLKEPLRSIDAFGKFIEEDYKDKLADEGKNYLERIRANTKRMQTLIEDLLTISRIERRKNPFEEVELTEMIEELKLRLEYAIKEKNIKIIIRDKLPKISCDRVRLAEVFANLMSNAIKFNDKKHPAIEIGSELKGDFYEFYVRDNGPGIEKQYFEKIFQIFQRLERREKYEGTGAGLTIVKKIVQMHKGKIWVESKVGEHTTFYFTIPKSRDLIIDRKKIGEILVEKKVITEEDVDQALKEQKKTG